MDIQEKYDDLYNLVQNLEMAIRETDLKDFKEDIQLILFDAQDELKDVEEKLAELQEKQWKEEADERYSEYRQMQGF